VGVIRGVVFDMDDTLYLEREYVRSGFARVAAHVAERGGRQREELFAHLWGGFEAGVRGSAFDELLARFGLEPEKVPVGELVSLYREHAPSIELAPQTLDLLHTLRAEGLQLGVITDGPVECQGAKARALGVRGLCDPVVLTGEWGREYWKPHPRAFEHVQACWELPPEALVYVADNPEKDFLAPRRLGWRTVRLRMAGQLRAGVEAPSEAHAPEVEIEDLRELHSVLREEQRAQPNPVGTILP
jgi:putative hydrolase of the HAD superfamily